MRRIAATISATTRSESVWKRRLKIGAAISASAMVMSGLVASPAAAHEFAYSADVSTWPTPFSPLPASEIVANNNVTLEFDGTQNGLHAGTGAPVDTGFTMVQPSSGFLTSGPTAWALTGAKDVDYFQPGTLSVADGKLTIPATKGIAFESQIAGSEANVWRNRQDNTLGVGLAPATTPIRLQTTFTNPAGLYNSAQAGVWFGTDDNNFFKVVLAGQNNSASDTVRQFQIKREGTGLGVGTGSTTTDSTTNNELTVPLSTGQVPVGAEITVFLDINPVTLKATGSYKINNGAVTPIVMGSVTSLNVPASFVNGPVLSGLTGVETFGGIFTTKRNMPEATPAAFTFSRFQVNEIDTTAPAAPTAPQATPSAVSTQLTWTAPADADLAGYRVYRSTTSPVATIPANLVSGSALLSSPEFTDTQTFVGQTWNYAVVAADVSGNVSAAATATGVVPAPPGTLVDKIDFTTPAGAPAQGYTKDAGAPYTEVGGFGWRAIDDDQPIDLAINTRIRAANSAPELSDPRLFSLIHMQYGMSGSVQVPPNAANGDVDDEGYWEYDLPNGRYNVVVAAGDTSSGNYDSVHTVVVEGEEAITGFTGPAGVYFDQGVVEAEVTDGRLTVAATGGDNTKLAFLEIYELELFGPPAPADLSAVLANDEESVTLTWDAVDEAVGYNVYRGDSSPVATTTPLNATPLTSTQFIDEGIAAGNTYYYTVVALGDGIPASLPAGEVSVVVAATPIEPSAPTGVTAAADADSITVAWQASEGATGYRVFRGGSTPVSTDGAPISGSTALTSTSFDDTTAQPGIQYHYVVVAVGSADFVSAASATASATVEQPTGPGECIAAEWSGTFFSGTALQGAPIAEKCFDELSFEHLQSGSPTAGVPGDNYSARFVKMIDEGAGDHTFTVRADDGVRVKVDGVTVLDRWSYSTDASVFTVPLAAGAHEVVVEYFQQWGGGSLSVDYTVAVDTCVASEWSGSFFSGMALQGTPLAVDCFDELAIEHAQSGSPLAGVTGYNYSARFVKTIDEGPGSYTFTVRADDGVRVKVDGVSVIDRWSYSPDPTVQTVALSAGAHEIVVEYFQEWGGAVLDFDYTVAVDTCVASEWSGSFFSGMALQGTPLAVDCFDELAIEHAQSGSPLAGVTGYNYSARFVKTIDEGPGSYTFTVRADDGVRVKVDGVSVIDRWSYSPDPTVQTVALSAGAHEIVVEYFQEWGGAVLSLDYERQGSDTTAPAAPTDLNINVDENSLSLEWDASTSSDTAGYDVYRGTSAGVTAATGQKLNAALLATNGYVDSTVVVDTTYYYVVVAVDGAGNRSTVSNEASGRITSVPDTEAPAAPTVPAAAAASDQVTLSWTAPTAPDVAGYRVYRSLEAGAFIGGQVISGDGLVTTPTFVDLEADNGTTYFYQVVAVDTSGNSSPASNEVYATPRPTNTTNIKVDFTLTNGVPATGYLADWGQAYGLRSSPNQGTGLTYGWADEDGHALSLVTNGRDRGRAGVDDRLDSILHMQYGDVDSGNGTNGIKTAGKWEMALPGGVYQVTVGVGDQKGETLYDSQHTVNVEGSVAINSFQATAAKEFEVLTTTVGVWDGKLTLDALGGFNTKIGFVDIVAVPFARPHIESVAPLNRSTDAGLSGVAATIAKVHAGGGVDNPSMIDNVRVYNVATGVLVPGTVNSSGGNDTVNFAPNGGFQPNTTYRFEVTEGVKDLYGLSFLPFSSIFTTGAGIVEAPDEFTPLQNIAFDKVELPIGTGKYWASFSFGPDGKLYGTTVGQGLYRFTVAADGTLSNMENLGYAGFAMIGLLWDKSSTAGNLKVWVTKTSSNVGNEQAQFISGISLLTGANLQNEKKVFTGLPRSQSDHLTNSMVYGPNDDILVLQGSNQAAGDLDSSWGQRGEQLLTAALLHFDPDHTRIQAAVNDAEGDFPQLVQTAASSNAGENTTNGYNAATPYDPFAANAPLKIYATGIRNAYDLAYHSNGHIYVATNGTAGGANSPGVTYNPTTGTFTRVAAAGIPGFSSVNGQNLTAACQARVARTAADPTVPDYVPTSVPAVSNHPTQRDHLYDVKKGMYYGHPNPTRCEFVLHEGNDPSKPPVSAGQGGTKYPSGVKAEPNYGGIAYDFEFNKSPNGTIEYKSSTFGGQLKNRLIVVRFSNNNDLIFLQADPVTGKILGAQTEVGITGVPNTTMQGVGGFNDPLEVVEDTRNGNLYINQYDRAGSSQKLYLLRVPASQQAAKVAVSADELVFSAVKSTGSVGSAVSTGKTDVKSLTITNSSTETVNLTAALSGPQASEFTLGTVPATLAAGASTTVQATFTPGSTTGQRNAQVTFTSGATSIVVGLYGLSLNGIEGGNEPTFNDVVKTLGVNVNVGWTNLAGGMQPTAKGDEILEPIFVKAGTGPVTWKPLAQFAPPENLGFGWYTGDGAAADRRSLGGMNGTNATTGGYQRLNPPVVAGSTQSFDPGAAEMGFYYYSAYFNRYGFTEDRLNSPAADAHRARIYPAKNRSGVVIPNTYLIGFEDASNGDYQDYVFLVSGIKPKTDTGSIDGSIKVDFTTAAGDLAAGYLRDFGQAFGSRTGADQGTGLTYGWKDLTTEDDVNISVGGTTPGNGRDRGSIQADVRLDSFMHMQPAGLTNFNGTPTNAYWEIQVPNGTYDLTIGVGDPNVGSDPESHVVNAESVNVVSAFAPSGAAGSNTRHKVSTARVEVTDGHLTIDPVGGVNTKIGFIDIAGVDVVEEPGTGDPSEGAQVKITFQPTATEVPTGWTAETGAAFSASRGFGWLDAANGQPVDRAVATRYRTTAMSGITFPTDGRLKGFSFLDNSSQPTYTNGVWEYAVPNGEYEVAVSVGDANYIDSTHGVQVEGQPVIQSFVPTAATPFQTGVRDVVVTDGRITLANNGTNTKINWISIKGDALEPSSPTTTARFSFRPATSAAPTGWTADTGAAYSAAAGYGWMVGGAPTDRSGMTRLRTTPAAGITFPTGDATRQGLILMQNLTTTGTVISGGTIGVWEYAVPNGTYTVSASVGDAGFLDSVHGVAVEGQQLIPNYTPTGTAPFASGTKTVTVVDGRISLSATGTNTKLNWVSITGTALSNPAVSLSINGAPAEATYSGGAATIGASVQVAEGATLQSLTYTVNGGAATPYTTPVTLSAEGNYTVVFTATDSGDRTTSKTVTLEVLDIGGTLTLANQQVVRQSASGAPLPGLYDDVLIMHRVNSLGTSEVHQTLKYNDTAVVNLTNTGTKDLRITALTLGGAQAAQFEIVSPPTLPLFLDAGQTVPLTVKFIANSGSKGVRTATLTVASSDPAQALRVIQLRGGYMTGPEGNNELSLEQIFQLYNSATTSGTPNLGLGNGSEIPGAPMDGDEIRSGQWKRLDSSKPVQAVQLAAFHGCCNATETFNVNGASATHATPYGQAIYPLKSDGSKTAVSTNPTGNFSITVAGQSTTQTAYIAVKMWPVKDAAGKAIPGAWFAGHDYISSPAQCGTGPTNCDYQDNVYLITNILPVTSSDTVAPAAPGSIGGAADATGVNLAWPASTDGDLIGYRVERSAAATGPWAVVSGTGILSGTSFRDTTAAAAATTYYRVVAVDASGNVTPGAAVAVDTSAIVAQAILINAGGPTVTTGGRTWVADTPYIVGTGTKTYSNPAVTAIAGTTDDVLYLTERSTSANLGTVNYAIPVTGTGTYQVKLHFAELYWGATSGGAGGTGKRVFSVNLEGGPIEINNLDINAQVAPMTAYVTTNTISVTDGVLNIALTASVNQPKVSAIEIVKIP